MHSGSTGFMLICAALVLLITPGLALFYGGLGDQKNVISIMKQSFVSMGVTTLVWYAVGYSLVFSGDVHGVIGNLNHIFMIGISPSETYPGTHIPTLVFAAFQMMFAIITPALISGGFINRVSFKAYLLFLILWQLLVYYPVAHMVWGGGILAKWGILDFAGGLVAHPLEGMAALASVFFVGKRHHTETAYYDR